MKSTLFFFNDTATTEIYTLSLHDALPSGRCDEDRLVCGRTTFNAHRKGLNPGRLRFGQNVRKRSKVRYLNPTEPHCLDHRGVIGSHHNLNILLELLFKIALKRLRVLDDAGSVLIWKKGDTKL